MKFQLIFSFLLLIASYSLFAQIEQKPDTAKKYRLELTESQYRGLQNALHEAALYEAEIQQQNIEKGFMDFLQQNAKPIIPKAAPTTGQNK